MHRTRLVTRVRVAATLVVATLVAAACGGGSASTTTSAPDNAGFAIQFLSIITPYSQAVEKFNSLNTLDMTTAQFHAAIVPVTTALARADSQILEMGLTGQTAADARAFVAANKVLITQFGALTPKNLASKAGEISADSSTASAAEDVLRSDLGIPVTNSTSNT